MEQNRRDLNNKIYSNNNDILLEIVNDLQQLLNNSKDDLIMKTLGNAINKINHIISENKKYDELIRNDISLLQEKLDNLEINNKNKQELKFADGRYVGQVLKGLPEGKGMFYYPNGDRYEGDWKSGKREGKGIYYYKSGSRYEGDWRNDKKEGKGIFYWDNGDRYEGDIINGKREGKGIIYFANGDRRMGDFLNDKKKENM